MVRLRITACLLGGLWLVGAWPGPVAAQSDPAQLRRALRQELAELRSRLTDESSATPPAALRPTSLQASLHGGPRTVLVRCDRGQTIGRALKKPGAPLVVEVRGFCDEDVVISRDDVVLRGADPLADGVRGVGTGTSSLDGVIEVRGARDVTLENLTVTGGDRSGIALDRADNVTVGNCRVRDNGTRGLVANYSSNIIVTDTAIAKNGQLEISAFNSRPLSCTRCTIDASQRGVAASGSDLNLTSSSVTSPVGALSAFNSTVGVFGSTIRLDATSGFAVLAIDLGVVNFSGSEVHGALGTDNGSMFLSDTNQATNERGLNIVTASRLRVYGTSSLLATGPFGTIVDDFGSLVLSETSTITGSLECFWGGDAFCADPASVSGTSSCGQCPKP